MTVIRSISRSTPSLGASSRISITLMSLSSCFTTWSMGFCSASTTIVILENRVSTVGATAKEWML